MFKSLLGRHFYRGLREVIATCLFCGLEIKKKDNKFCNKSCAASYNNTKRVRSESSKLKSAIANIVHGKFSKFPELQPVKELKSRRPINHAKCGGLNLCRYEEKLKPMLEKVYGKLQRVGINGIAIDFSNDNYLIEFSFDSTAGVSSVIKRFSSVKEDPRKKIAYIPFTTGVGKKRIQKLHAIGVNVLDSLLYADLRDIKSKYDVGPWCNSNTTDFDSVNHRAIRCGPANLVSKSPSSNGSRL